MNVLAFFHTICEGNSYYAIMLVIKIQVR